VDPLMPHIQQRLEAEIAASRKTGVVPERREIALSDQKGLLNLDIRDVLTNDVEVYDDRKRKPR
jgi:hypothetical protein